MLLRGWESKGYGKGASGGWVGSYWGIGVIEKEGECWVGEKREEERCRGWWSTRLSAIWLVVKG